ncbi:protein MpCYP826A1 [Marchantia polymorpha subsp. ruderalis]
MELVGAFLIEWMTLSTLLIPVILISLIVFSTFRKFNPACGGTTRELPPRPFTAYPIVGSLLQLMFADKAPHRFVEDLLVKYGPIILIKVGHRRQVFVGSSELSRECLEAHDAIFASRPKRASSRYLSFGNDDLANVAYGDQWLFLRRIYTDELLSPKKGPLFAKIRSEELSLFVRSIMKQQRGNNPIYVNLRKRIVEITLNIITMMVMSARSFPYADINVTNKAFGRVYSEREIDEMRTRGPDWREYSSQLTTLFTTPLMEDTIPVLGFVDSLSGKRHKMKRAKRRLVELYKEVIENHKQKREKHPATETDFNFLDTLLAMPGPNDEPNLSEDTIMGLLQSTVATGSLSTSATIEWALAHLLKYPHCMKRCYEEMDTVVGRRRCVEEADIPNLPYLRAVVKETFRLTPTGPLLLPHFTTSDCKIGEYDIPAKTAVSFHVWAIGRNALTTPNPLTFDPERFLNSPIDIRGQHFELFPFGAGRRCCPAIDLSMAIVQFTLARLIQSFTWSLIGDMTPEKLDMREVFGMMITRLKPLEANAIPRLSPDLF